MSLKTDLREKLGNREISEIAIPLRLLSVSAGKKLYSKEEEVRSVANFGNF